MTPPFYDVIVIGVGGMGSAAVYDLTKRGRSVLGLERFDIPHERGSSHGVTRIIRLAYYENPSYVPLLKRSYVLWRELEARTGEKLLHITGSIDAGPPQSPLFSGSLRSCAEHGLSHQVLSAEELARRFPGYRLPEDFRAVWQEDGGFLLSERCIVAHTTQAQEMGARIQARERVLKWTAAEGEVRVHTDRGEYRGGSLVITAGAWSTSLLPIEPRHAVPERQVLAWFQPLEPHLFQPESFPVFNISGDEADIDRYYGFPVFGIPGFKIGRYHHLHEVADPETFTREIYARDEEILRAATERFFPAAAGATMALKTCLFTNSADEHFLIGTHHKHPNVVFAGGFSGHGFKFCSVVGEILGDLVSDGTTRHPIDLFRPERFPDFWQG